MGQAMGCPWPVGGQDRYKNHKNIEYRPPTLNGKLPQLLALAMHRLHHLVEQRSGRLPWKPSNIRIKTEGKKHLGATFLKVREGIHNFHFHYLKLTEKGNHRQRRDQALHSADLVLRHLAATCNVQTNHKTLDFLECRRTDIERAAAATGLSRSAVRDALKLLEESGFLRTQRVREATIEGLRERPARRWLTPHLFAALGLARPYHRQLSGGRKAFRARQPEPGRPWIPESSPIELGKERTADELIEADVHLEDMRKSLRGPPKKPT